MSDFLGQFKTDPEFPDERWFFTVQKPFLKDFFAEYAAFDEEFHTYKLPIESYPIEPSGVDARIADDSVPVFIFEKNPETAQLQQSAWQYILANSAEIERKLKAKLTKTHSQGIALLAEEIEDGGPYQAHWEMIQANIPGAETEISRFFKLVAIVLDASGLEDHAFVGFEFQTAWDKDHGLEIVMHKDRILARAGMTELISGYGSTIDGIRGIQAVDLEPGDFKVV